MGALMKLFLFHMVCVCVCVFLGGGGGGGGGLTFDLKNMIFIKVYLKVFS
jgi:hypothetical protein